jgi:hypothetical protein
MLRASKLTHPATTTFLQNGWNMVQLQVIEGTRQHFCRRREQFILSPKGRKALFWDFLALFFAVSWLL